MPEKILKTGDTIYLKMYVFEVHSYIPTIYYNNNLFIQIPTNI